MKRTHRFLSFFLILALIAAPVLPVSAAEAGPVIEAVADAANIKKYGNVGVTVVMNLTDTAETARSYEGYAGSYYASVDSIALGMGMDFTTAEKAAQMVMPAFSYYTDENGETRGMAELTADAANAAGNDGEIDLSQKGIRIGVGNGTVQELLVMQQFPEAELLYYDKLNGYAAVAQGKIDAYIYDKKQMELAVANGLQGVRILDQTLGEPTRIAVGISKLSSIPNLENQVNRFIRQSKQDGTLDDMYDRWVNRGDFQMPEITGADSPQYHLVVGTTGDVEPYSFFEGTTVTGYDIELAYRLAAWLDADVELQIFGWDGIVPAVQTGKADLIASNLQVSPERAEELLYSDTLYEEENGVMVRDTGAGATTQTSGEVRWQDYNGKRIGVLVGPLMEDAAAESVKGDGTYQSLDELAGKRIGVVTGTIHDGLVAQRLPTAQRVYFTEPADMLAALEAGKIDAFAWPKSGAVFMRYEYGRITWLDESLQDGDLGFIFPKTEEGRLLNERFSDFIRDLRANGSLDALTYKWFGADERSKAMIDYSTLPATNGTLRMATAGTTIPFTYVRDNAIVGFEIELAALFCAANGYCLQVEQMNFDGIWPPCRRENAILAAPASRLRRSGGSRWIFRRPITPTVWYSLFWMV